MNKRLVYRVFLVLMSVTTLYLLTTCAKKIINDDHDTAIQFKIAVEYSTAELADLIVKYRVTISASDMETITATLEERNGIVSGEVREVPEGSGRNILLEALDVHDTVIYAGSVDTSIIAGQTVRVNIQLEPVVSIVRLSPKFSSAQSTDTLTVEVRACNVGDLSHADLAVVIDTSALDVTGVTGDNVDSFYFNAGRDSLYIAIFVNSSPPDTGAGIRCLDLATLQCSCLVADFCSYSASLGVDVLSIRSDTLTLELPYTDGMTTRISGFLLDVTPGTLSFQIPAPGPYLHGVFSLVESCGNGDIPYSLEIDESVDWFTISSQSGLTPAVCTVGINTAGMPYETSYFDSIRVTSQLATDTSFVYVLLNIGDCPPPLPPGSPVGQIGHLYGDTVATLIMWLQSGSPDVAGYNVYKSSGDGDFTTINDNLITQNPMDPSFGNFLHIDYDLNTTSQVRLRYYVTAVSDSGCESSNSDTITFVPADISDSSQTRVQNLQPMDGWFSSDVPTFTWNSEPGAESYMILLTPNTPGNDPAIWLYRHTDTSFQLGEQLGMTYMPLATAHSPLVGGQLYRFQVYPINSDRAVYRWGEATFEAIGPEGFLGITECEPPGAEDSRDWRNHGSTRYGVAPACPNPASMPVSVGLSNMDDGTLDWYVLSSLSDTVKVGQSSFMPAGHHYFVWDLTDDESIRLVPDIYRFCLRINDFQTYGDIQVLDYSDTVPAPTSPLGLMGYTEHGDTIMTVIFWIEPDYHDIAGYNVYKSVGGGAFDTLNDSLITGNPINPAWPNCLWVDYGNDTSSTVVHRYYIKTVNSAGSESEASDTISFVPSVLWQAMMGEGSPRIENLRPRDGLFGSTSPTFSWDPVAGSQGYAMMLRPTGSEGDEPVMWIYGSNATSMQLGETGGLTYVPLEYSPLIAGTYYHFNVFAINSDNAVYMMSEGSTFEAIGPEGFTGITRTDVDCVVDSSEVDTSDWCDNCGGGPLPSQFCSPPACPNPASDFTEINLGLPQASDYTVYIFDNIDADFALVNSLTGYGDAGMLAIEWDLTDSNGVKLDTGIYRCLVKAGDFSCWGDIRITDCTILSAPGLVSPINGDTGVSHTPTLIWHDVDGADNYEVEVDTDSTFTDSPASGYIVDTTVVPQIPISDTVYWHVRALSSCDTSDWSDTWHFTTTDTATGSVCVSLWMGEDSCIDISSPFATGEVWVGLYMNAAEELGGFDLLIDYDPSSMSFEMATIATTEIEAWEYFIDSIVDSNRIRLVAIADVNNGPFHPPTESLTPNGLAVLLQFFVAFDSNLYGQYLPIDFYWVDCGVNTLSNVDGSEDFVDLQIYSAESVLIWDEDDDINYPEGSRPAGLGFSDDCLTDFPDARRCAIFQHGGVCVAEPAPCQLQCFTSAITFPAIEGGPDPTNALFTVSEAGGGNCPFAVSWDSSWFSVVPDTGTTPAQLTVSIDISGLAAGTYIDTIWVTSPQDPDSVSVRIQLDLSPVGGDFAASFTASSGSQMYIFDSTVSVGDVVGVSVVGSPDDYDVPWCDGIGCCISHSLYDAYSLARVAADTIHLTGGYPGANWLDGWLEVRDSLSIDTVFGSIGVEAHGAWYQVSPDRHRLEWHGGQSDDGCSCSDCGRLNLYIVLAGTTPSCTTVWIAADAGLEAAVRNHIGKPTNTVWLCDVDTITNLDASGRSIYGLGGIQYLIALDTLNLFDNQITDIGLLAALTSLSYLDLSYNQTSDIESLAEMDSLVWLNLFVNQIIDITPLAGLTSLSYLYLADNQIVVITSLAGLDSLVLLNLFNNQVEDISPLVANSGLAAGDTVHVWYNPLNDSSINIHIPALTDRGVVVRSKFLVFDPDTLYFYADSGGTNPAAQQVLVSEAGNFYSLDYTMEEFTSWLWLTNPSGTTPGSTMVYVDITGFSVGGYSDSIEVTSAQAYYSTKSVYCSLVVSSPDAGLVFPDTGLEGAIRDHISKPTGPIYVSDVDTITYLDASSRNISDLGGIQHLTALDTLGLAGNNITDISPLVANGGLAGGDYVGIQYNPLSDSSICSHIPTLTDRGVIVYSNYFRIDPQAIYFTAEIGGPNPVPETLRVYEAGGQTVLNYTISRSITWCGADDTTGSTPDSTTVHAEISGLATGNHYGYLILTSAQAYNSPDT
ncbi:MAG: leucine-rich repeat domain-containing protein, partial [bacterium]